MLRPCKGRPFLYLQGFESMARPLYCPFPFPVDVAEGVIVGVVPS